MNFLVLTSLLVLLTASSCLSTPVETITKMYYSGYSDGDGDVMTGNDVEDLDRLFGDLSPADGEDDDDTKVHEDPDPNDELTFPTKKNDTDRIIGGWYPNLGYYEFAARVYGRGSCGGTLLSSVWVLTAAHCVFPNVNRVTVRVGSLFANSGGQFRDASRWFWATNYRHFTNSAGGYDIGLIKMNRAVSFNSYTYPALIVNRNYRPNLGDTLYAVGWGRTSRFNQDESNQLKATEQSVRNCVAIPPNTPDPSNSIICTWGTDNFSRGCNGDSGGFIGGWSSTQNNWIVVGAYSYSRGDQCDGPVGYTSAAYFNQLIWNTINNN